MRRSIQMACHFIFAGILTILMVGCSGQMNVKEDKRKYLSKMDPASAQRGKELYQIHCQRCHGESGRGDGPAAKGLETEPANLVESGVHVTRYGMRAFVDYPHYSPDSVKLRMKYGNDTMPGFKNNFTEQELEDIANHVLVLMHP